MVNRLGGFLPRLLLFCLEKAHRLYLLCSLKLSIWLPKYLLSFHLIWKTTGLTFRFSSINHVDLRSVLKSHTWKDFVELRLYPAVYWLDHVPNVVGGLWYICLCLCSQILMWGPDTTTPPQSSPKGLLCISHNGLLWCPRELAKSSYRKAPSPKNTAHYSPRSPTDKLRQKTLFKQFFCWVRPSGLFYTWGFTKHRGLTEDWSSI